MKIWYVFLWLWAFASFIVGLPFIVVAGMFKSQRVMFPFFDGLITSASIGLFFALGLVGIYALTRPFFVEKEL